VAVLVDGCTFAVIDVETTGIDAVQDRIVEIAVLTCDRTGAALDHFETLVRPADVALTPARAEMLAGAPPFAEVAGEVISRLAGRIVAGHNVSFDLRFLDAELERLGHRVPTHTYVCTRELATLLGCDVPNRTLAALSVYFGVAFDRWHTAADDTMATAAVLAHLLDRAAGFGRVELDSLAATWPGLGGSWPRLAAGGRRMVRDVSRWPPQGDQPGGRRATEASFRRLGAGPASPSGAVVVGAADGDTAAPPGSASQLWWEGDFRGLAGIEQLQERILPTFRAGDDPELTAALLALADLLRRHGGRDAEVRAVLAEAYGLATRRGDWDSLNRVVEQWAAHLAALRDVAGQVELMSLTLDTPGCPWNPHPVSRLAASVVASSHAEPLVAEGLAGTARAALAGRGDQRGDGEVLAAWVRCLERAGREAEAVALVEQAWNDGVAEAGLLDWLSQRLERADDVVRALDVCARALAAPRAGDAQVLESLRKRHKRCQERLAKGATLFG